MKDSLAALWLLGARRAGAYGVVAIALALSAVALALWIPRLEAQGEALRVAHEEKAKSTPKPSTAVAVRRIPVGQQIGDYVAEFPLLSQRTEDLKEVFLSAKRNRLQLARGDYQFKNDAKSPLVTLTATFPVTADYGSLKGFTADVLRALPNASMDELRMARSTTSNTQLESSVRFTFNYRRP